MKRNSAIFLLGLVAAVFSNCEGQTGFQRLNPDSFQKKMDDAPEKILLDVRTVEEYNKGHLTNAMLLDYYGKDFKDQVSRLDKDKPVFVYCAAGPRSESATKIMNGLGFKEVYFLQGGINAWTKAKKPVEQ